MAQNVRKVKIISPDVNPIAFSSTQPDELLLEKTVRGFTEKNNSAETRRTYKSYLKEFFAFAHFKSASEALGVDSSQIIAWREKMKATGRKANTVKTKLAAVRSFYEHLKHLGLIENNPASVFLVAPPKTGSEPKGRALSVSQVRLLLELPKTDTIIGARDYALILLMLRTFMRVAEAVALTKDDFFFHQKNWYAKVKTKGGEMTNVPIPSKVKRAIDHYHFLDRDRRSRIKIENRVGKLVFMP